MPKTLIKLPEVQRRTGHGRAWIYRLIQQKRFPPPVKNGSRSSAWVESEVDAWVEARIAERDQLNGHQQETQIS